MECNEKVNFTIEDIFDEDYYLKKIKESHKSKISDAKKKPADLTLGKKGNLLLRAENGCKKLGISFNKGSVAKLIRKDLLNISSAQQLEEKLGADTKQKAERLIKAIVESF